MKRITTWMLALVLTSLLAACGGTYTTTRGIDSLGTTSPTSVASSAPGAGETMTAGATMAASATTDTSTSAAMTASGTMEATSTAMSTMTEASTMMAATTSAAMTPESTMTTSTAMTSMTPVADLKGRALLVGSDTTYPPIESLDKDKKIVGFDPDLMAMIAQLINVKPEFKTANFDTIFTALAAKQYDVVMSAVTITDDRKKIVDFSDPYLTVGQLVVVLKTNTAIKSYTDLKSGNFKVGVQRGTTGEKAALEKAGVADANVKRYDDVGPAFADLKNNAIDAIVADNPTVANYTTQAQYKDVVMVVGTPFTNEDYGIALQKGDKELLDAINKALAVLKQSGKIDELKAKYSIK